MPRVKTVPTKATTVVADLIQRNPKCVDDYINVRRTLVDLEAQRRELEEEVIEYAHIQIMEGNTVGSVLNLYGEIADEVELALMTRKPTEKQIVASNPDLSDIAEHLETDREETRERNADKINQLITAMEELSAEIEQLSYSEGGHALLKEYKAELKAATKTAGSAYSIRFKELRKNRK
jgi:nucleoid-associated protein YejK